MHYRTALVTGASKGIGAAITAKLIEEGLTVYGLARNLSALDKQASEFGESFKPVVADVRDHATIAAALGETQIDILVNNAGGLATVRPLYEQSAEETVETIELNLIAPLLLIRHLLPQMIQRKCGHIFNLTSTAASAVFTGTTAYGAAKAGLSRAGDILRYDLAGTGVRLTEIAPGRVETEFYVQAFGGDKERLRDQMYTRQRPLRPEDIATVLVDALRLPAHVDIGKMLVTPTEQAAGGSVYPPAPHS
ncbi:serine 3-dehydrogenase [Brucella sp. NBRC 13694]|uniref:SDR family oxidoreductase n=1 Tax=Brucella sp. NBRC 13694 TaxID=3075482 RepID=UPI0028B0451A|nr:SDR family oxidoreductase [Brucella anthropi]